MPSPLPRWVRWASTYPRPTTRSPSSSATQDPGLPLRIRRVSSRHSSRWTIPTRARIMGPAWAWPLPSRLSRCMGAASGFGRVQARGRRSGARSRGTSHRQGGGMTAQILIVEDNVDSREILRDLLTSVGYAVLEAATGSQGVCAAVTHSPDLILMDLHLPGMDGYEATRRIKAHPALGHIPVIAVTAYALSGDDVTALAAGCDGYV